MRIRGILAALLVGASSAVFAVAWPWPQPPAPPAPVAEEDRLALYEESLDVQWEGWIGQNYPEAERPAIDSIEVLPSSERDDVVRRCLESAGWAVTDYSSGYATSMPSGADPESLDIGQFVCEARYPYEGQFDFLMSVEQRSALYDYYTGFLSACLAFSGMDVDTREPSRASFVADSVMWPSWTPYTSVWTRADAEDEFAELERRCPSEPAWRRPLNLFAAVDG